MPCARRGTLISSWDVAIDNEVTKGSGGALHLNVGAASHGNKICEMLDYEATEMVQGSARAIDELCETTWFFGIEKRLHDAGEIVEYPTEKRRIGVKSFVLPSTDEKMTDARCGANDFSRRRIAENGYYQVQIGAIPNRHRHLPRELLSIGFSDMNPRPHARP
jgi:hypothetical protein